MCEKTEKIEKESRPLDNNGGWEKQVNGRADEKKAEEERRICWAEEQKAKHIAEKRIRRIMSMIALALALIIGGSIYLNYVEGLPAFVAALIVVIGNSLFWFVIGWIFGHKEHR